MTSFGSFDPAIAAPFVAKEEGRRLSAYQCSAGVWTIGYGHTKGVSEGDTISASEADALLVSDLSEHARALAPFVNVPITKGQFIALLSLAFNVGAHAVKKSTLLRLLNTGHIDEAGDAFLDWRFAGGKESPGLLARRERERKLFLTGDS